MKQVKHYNFFLYIILNTSLGFAPGEGQIESDQFITACGSRICTRARYNPKHNSKPCQRYIESKEEQHVLQLMSWLAQSMNWCDMNLTKKPELNNPQVQLTSGNSCRKAGKNYLWSTSSLWWKECRVSVKE